ncbi:hypothetical protein CDD83_10962 [Cordyceps sp. RAO-2017]|nr:hypothetical protein CDD83_10962 [Cordyceps sp. RAO-2017]
MRCPLSISTREAYIGGGFLFPSATHTLNLSANAEPSPTCSARQQAPRVRGSLTSNDLLSSPCSRAVSLSWLSPSAHRLTDSSPRASLTSHTPSKPRHAPRANPRPGTHKASRRFLLARRDDAHQHATKVPRRAVGLSPPPPFPFSPPACLPYPIAPNGASRPESATGGPHPMDQLAAEPPGRASGNCRLYAPSLPLPPPAVPRLVRSIGCLHTIRSTGKNRRAYLTHLSPAPPPTATS